MQHGKVDIEISELQKQATIEAKNKSFVEAIDVMKVALEKVKKSELLYSDSTYIKVIPYFQKAGLYTEVEEFCLNELIPSIRTAFHKGMPQRCIETREVHFFQYVSKVYDKLRLAAKREKNGVDETRFIKERESYSRKWQMLQPKAQQIELEKEYLEACDVFGNNIDEWPEVIKRQFNMFLQKAT